MSSMIEQLFISPGHNFFGHHGQPAGKSPLLEVSAVECVAGRGLRGDRFFDYKENYKGQITFFAREVFDDLCQHLGCVTPSPGATRRNAITRGIDLNELIGRQFAVQGIEFEGICECKPCYWMDQAIAPGAEAALQGRGGLRARILSSGTLRAEGTTQRFSRDRIDS
jgi:MOSC domain-containing protein YiiM